MTTNAPTTLSTAQTLQPSLDSLSLNLSLLKSVKRFHVHATGGGDDEGGVDKTMDDLDKIDMDPAVVAADLAAQVSFFRKLKFQYLEQTAKDKYIKSIVSDIDDAPIVTQDDNKELQMINEKKKETLNKAKGRLNQKYADVRTLAPLVEQDYNKAQALTSEATTLSQKILDARLALTRLRQTHPHPRLTVSSASKHLESQVTQMQDLGDEVSALNQEVQNVKTRLKEESGNVERLRAERAEVEREVKRAGLQGEEDGRLVPLYDWYTASLAIHRSIASLVASNSVSENELRLTYLVESPSHSPAPVQLHLTITLLFRPNTRRLAAATVTGLPPDIDVGETVESHVQLDDARGLVVAVLALARGSIS